MSNALAIATVTATLSDLITNSAQSIVSGAKVIIGRPPATVAAQTHNVYLYLYHVVPHIGLRNDDLPTRNGEAVRKKPRIPLVLHYVVVFQGESATFEPERMLGAVVRDFHARPLLAREDIETAIANRSAVLQGSNLPQAFERVRLTQTPLTLEELSKLWSIFFQVPHAVTVAYEASLVELEADETPRTPKPVLYRGEEDRGVYLEVGPFPIIDAIQIADGYPTAALGRQLIVTGQQLTGNPLWLRVRHARLGTTNFIAIPAADANPDRLTATIPSGAAGANWASGIVEVTLAAGGTQNDPTRISNTVPLALAPTLQPIAPNTVARDGDHNANITVTVAPPVRPGQRVSLLLDGSETVASPPTTTTGTITFVVEHPEPAAKVRVQVRVDGVDSMPFQRSGNPPVIELDPAQTVDIT